MIWLMNNSLLANVMNCKKCSTPCRIVTKKDAKVWRCPQKGCQAVISVRNDSFFTGSHLKLNEIVDIIYWWSRKAKIHVTMHETGHYEHTIVDWFNFLRDVCAQYFIDHPTTIGGPGSIVEIDESKFGRRKYNRGRYEKKYVVKPKENIVEKEGVPQHYTASIEQLLTMIKLGHLLSQFDAVHLMALKYHCYNRIFYIDC